MNIKKNFLVVENLKKMDDIGTNFNDRAIPISFADFNKRYDLEKQNILPIHVTQHNFFNLIWQILKSNLKIFSIEVGNNEELSDNITQNIIEKNLEKVQENLEEIEYNEFEIKSIRVEINKNYYRINKQGVVTVEFDENIKIEDVLYEKFLFDALGV
nr:hypothetical protein [Mammaliicoccus lentus]